MALHLPHTPPPPPPAVTCSTHPNPSDLSSPFNLPVFPPCPLPRSLSLFHMHAPSSFPTASPLDFIYLPHLSHYQFSQFISDSCFSHHPCHSPFLPHPLFSPPAGTIPGERERRSALSQHRFTFLRHSNGAARSQYSGLMVWGFPAVPESSCSAQMQLQRKEYEKKAQR